MVTEASVPRFPICSGYFFRPTTQTVPLMAPHFRRMAAPKGIRRCREALDRIICELEKQIRIGPFLRGECKFAISDRATAAHGNSNPNATREGSSKGGEAWFRLYFGGCKSP
jgi:hypothetical protein